ncbi:hypothetical protein P7C70_g628, partial [Phenoliferia sp. Uapishka_3]
MDRVGPWLANSDPTRQPRSVAPAIPDTPPRRGIIDMTGSEASSPASTVLSAHSIPARTPPPPVVQKPYAPIFQQANRAPGAFDKLAGSGHPTFRSDQPTHQPLRAVENGAYRDVQAPTSSGSAKARAMLAMQAERAKLDLPKPIPKPIAIGIPQNPPYRRARESIAEADEDEDELTKAMKSLDVGDNLAAGDQESALKALLESAMDLDGVDTTAEAPAELTTKLFPHQVLGLHWLKDRESGKKRGGILGDDIVCPVGLMDQWKKEIEKHSDGSLRVGVHHGAKRETGKARSRTIEFFSELFFSIEARRLRKFDVLITSYNTAASEWIDPKPKKKKGKGKNGSDDDASAGEETTKETGALFDPDIDVFHRTYFVFVSSLDEAHVIKGRSTRMHKACCDLRAKYRWCLTGTPVQNEVMDLFSLFEFLGKVVKPLNEFSVFKTRIADPLKNKRAKVAMARLVIVLNAVMLRRTKTMLVDGKPLLTLPGREIIHVKSEFLYAYVALCLPLTGVLTMNLRHSDERAFYNAVEQKMQLEMNSFLEAGTAMNNYTSVLILLLRYAVLTCRGHTLSNPLAPRSMRQACSHPALVTGHSIKDSEALEPEVQQQKPASAEETLDDLIGGLGKLNVEAPIVACVLCEKPAEEGGAYCEDCSSEGTKYGSLKFSTKIRRMIGTLEEIRTESKSRKTIVFSQCASGNTPGTVNNIACHPLFLFLPFSLSLTFHFLLLLRLLPIPTTLFIMPSSIALVASILALTAASAAQSFANGGLGRFPCTSPQGTADQTMCTNAQMTNNQQCPTTFTSGDPVDRGGGSKSDGLVPVSATCTAANGQAYFCGFGYAWSADAAQCEVSLS